MCCIPLIIDEGLAETIFVTSTQCAATIIGIFGMFLIFYAELWRRLEDQSNASRSASFESIELNDRRLEKLKKQYFGKMKLLAFIIPNVATIFAAMIGLLMLNGIEGDVSAIPVYVVMSLLFFSVSLVAYIIYDTVKSK